MKTHTLLIVGDDKVAARALAELPIVPDLTVALDRSTNLKRVFRLLCRGSLSLGLAARMFWSEFRRPSTPFPPVEASVACNADVMELIRRRSPERVILFRAGLIISRQVLSLGVPILNIHCAKLPEFGGIGAIYRGLRARDFSQCATLHRVTSSVDDGETIAVEPYELDPNLSYGANEGVAYEAGRRLLYRTLRRL